MPDQLSHPDANDSGEQAFFRELFDTYKLRLYEYIRSVSGSQYVAEEITQEVFVKLWQKRKDLGHVMHMDQYIFRMAKNKTINYLMETAADSKAAAALKQRILTDNNTVLDRLYAADSAALIAKAVASLPPQRRRVYELSRKEGFSLEEIAIQLHLTRSTAKNHLSLALREIRAYLVAHGYPLALALILIILYEN
jgi:RNA polymerase sigma-70 factor (ECF subfamily)